MVEFFIGKDFEASFLKKNFSDLDFKVLLAKDESKIIGFLVFEKLYGGVSFCSWLGVLKEYRGKGVGSLLLSEWEKLVASQGGHKLELATQEDVNREYYKKRGFKEEGFEEKAWFGLDTWKFGRLIGKPNPQCFFN